MPRLTDSPSQGKSEVLETLRYQGAIAEGVPLYRLGPMVSHRWGGDETRSGSDAQFESDLLSVLSDLAGDGLVQGTDGNGSAVDLTGRSPAGTTRVVLTGAGRAASRSPRPRPRRLYH